MNPTDEARSETTEQRQQREGQIAPLQLGLLLDVRHQTLQTRFEHWLAEAVDALTATDPLGEPVHDAGKVKSNLKITVSLTRTSNDSLHCEIDHEISVKHPQVPSKIRGAQFVEGIGLAQRVHIEQFGLFAAADGQPEPMSREDAERQL